MFLVQLCAVKVRRTTAFERDVKQARRLDLPVLLLDRLKSQICNDRRRRVRPPSSDSHISKTKQDSPLVTMEHNEVGIADSFLALRS